jgi:hypothetical protein
MLGDVVVGLRCGFMFHQVVSLLDYEVGWCEVRRCICWTVRRVGMLVCDVVSGLRGGCVYCYLVLLLDFGVVWRAVS